MTICRRQLGQAECLRNGIAARFKARVAPANFSTTWFVGYAVPPFRKLRMSFKIDLARLQTKQHLLSFLGVNCDVFDLVLSFDPREYDKNKEENHVEIIRSFPSFLRHEVPKKNPTRGVRIVWEPILLRSEYKLLSRRLASFFASRLEGYPHARCFGYVGGRNIRENAKDHCGHKNLVSVDIEDFFLSISADRIEKFLAALGVVEDVGGPLSKFVTIGGELALGLPTSPTISNAICFQMDIELQDLASRYEATFSRYADDISFSGNGAIPSVDDIERIVLRHDFRLAVSKTRYSTLGQAHYVTGLSVSDPNQPHVPKRKKRRLRQEMYYASKFGLYDHFDHEDIKPELYQQEINRLDGLVKFVAFHEPQLAARLKAFWLEILRSSGSYPSFEPKKQQGIPFFISVDEAELVKPDSDQKILALAMAVSQHQDRVRQGVSEVLDAYLSDPWAAGDRGAAIKRGLHFVDAHPDLRLSLVNRMCSMPFEAYVAFSKLSAPNEYEDVYLGLLRAMIRRRLMAAESKCAYFVFEKNDKISQTAVRRVVEDAFNLLAKTNNRRPSECVIEFKGKPCNDLCIPDFLLGALKKFLELMPERRAESPSRERLLFEQLRDKFRLILDLDSQREYSRRRPLVPWRESPET
jgi:hypothetical protein